MKNTKVIFLYCFLSTIILAGLTIAENRQKVIQGSKYTVPLKIKKTEVKEKSSGFSIFGIGVKKSTPSFDSFDVKIVYKDYYFLDENGLPVYYITGPMSCDVEITNKGDKDFEKLTITMIHEYYETGICERWWCLPYPVKFMKGEQLPGDSAMVWPEIDIKKGETVVLPFKCVSPLETCAGLDQTHVIIENKKEQYVLELYNDSEAGVFCPPAPE